MISTKNLVFVPAIELGQVQEYPPNLLMDWLRNNYPPGINQAIKEGLSFAPYSRPEDAQLIVRMAIATGCFAHTNYWFKLSDYDAQWEN